MKLEQFNVRVEPDIIEYYKARSIDEDRALNKIASRALREYMVANPLPKPNPKQLKKKAV